jgi:hypothetical protein
VNFDIDLMAGNRIVPQHRKREVDADPSIDLGIIAALQHMALCKPYAALVGLALAGVGMLSVFDPAVTAWFPSCPLYALTGWLCPFCGSLRAGHELLHGHVEAALALNPLTTVAAAAGLIALAHDGLRPARPSFIDRLVPLCFSIPGLTLAAAFGVLRNIISVMNR